ncbi:hypothetical protein Heshes_24330 [Alicyclobacillus hesperidum]|uniref:DUF3800 domain-containing protein n=1 Tax=Alicyclobacillus hesperidum TaxID=89784 RepID=A0A1H2X5B5_9BACL|nr:DUF3800 domain-containing protein [Alicyclobacillus hesperidum]GLV14749.1 hypothetical protein Heshes_24330 [Alicyclobacillus hesperidum]SDW87981.1 Protein of unknown function [Alicyclobacillus hesperidum]
MEYLIYCDESEKNGDLFTNFYGGALVRSVDYHEVVDALEQYKTDNHLTSEMKWTKVTAQYVDKYKGLMDVFFDLVQADKIKMRVMFQQKERSEPRLRNLTREQRDDSYFLLYYQFFKHAFGLAYSNPSRDPVYLKIFFDQIPDTREKAQRFKDYIYRLQFQRTFLESNLKIRTEDIIEATSHDHVILQCADIVTGAMWFRLNKLHLVKPEGSRFRAKRTKAKSDLYDHINRRLREIRPHFNIGVTTGTNSYADRWEQPYRHWLFVPNET